MNTPTTPPGRDEASAAWFDGLAEGVLLIHRCPRCGRHSRPDAAACPVCHADRLDWVAKLKLLEGYRVRDNLPWDSPKLSLIDLQYSDVRQAKGLYNRLVARGRIERVVSEDEVRHAIEHPPEDTRAYFRGRCLRQYADSVAAASWDSVIFDVPGRESLQRVPTLEPLRGTRQHVGALLDRCRTAGDLVATLTGEG